MATLVRWPDPVSSYSGFRDDAPQFMVNWRALVLHVMRAVPGVPDTVGMAVTLLLSVATVACVAVAWRGPWNPGDPTFPAKVGLLFVGTVLVNFHSHGYGAAVLVVPLIALLAQGTASALTKIAIGAGYVLPNAALVLQVVYDSEGIALASLLLAVCVLVTFGGLLQTIRTASSDPSGRSQDDGRLSTARWPGGGRGTS